jgi:shikimate kinase
MVERGNIILIGMPGCGKSTVGVLLAKTLGKNFLDTDVHIQARQGRNLQDIIDADGLEVFCKIESDYLLKLNQTNTVIATGGSAVYSTVAMELLRAAGVVVFLDISLDEIEKRLTNLAIRGVVMEPGETLQTLYAKRRSLYKKFAEVTINCNGLDHEQTIQAIIQAIGG